MKKVIIDSGFCVLRDFIGMFERGLYGSELVNNRRYFPIGIYLDGINLQRDNYVNILWSHG